MKHPSLPPFTTTVCVDNSAYERFKALDLCLEKQTCGVLGICLPRVSVDGLDTGHGFSYHLGASWGVSRPEKLWIQSLNKRRATSSQSLAAQDPVRRETKMTPDFVEEHVWKPFKVPSAQHTRNTHTRK